MTDHANVSQSQAQADDLLELTVTIVSAYVSNNPVQAGDLPGMIATTHDVLVGLQSGMKNVGPLEPAVPIKKSITDDHIICLEDGLKFKSLKRHLRSKFNLTPDQYREKWGLPFDYPMVAPGYSRKRSMIAKEKGLGRAS